MSNEYDYIVNYLNEVLLQVKSNLDPEAVEAVQYYITHNEYEMAFEGLFIDIMKLREAPKIDYLKGLDVVAHYHLDELTFFNGNFWSMFKGFVGANTNNN